MKKLLKCSAEVELPVGLRAQVQEICGEEDYERLTSRLGMKIRLDDEGRVTKVFPLRGDEKNWTVDYGEQKITYFDGKQAVKAGEIIGAVFLQLGMLHELKSGEVTLEEPGRLNFTGKGNERERPIGFIPGNTARRPRPRGRY